MHFPLSFYVPYLTWMITLSVYFPFIHKWHAFHIPSLDIFSWFRTLHPLVNCCKRSVFLNMNESQQQNASVNQFRYPFLQDAMTDFPVLLYILSSEIPTLLYT